MLADAAIIFGVIGLALAAAVVVLTVWFVQMRLRVNAAWKAYATKHGFEFASSSVGNLSMRGSLRNVPVQVSTECHDFDDRRTFFTSVTYRAYRTNSYPWF